MVLQEKLMDKTEYLNRAMEITDLTLRNVVNNKAKAYQRLKDYMRHDQLEMKKATDDDVRYFLAKYKKIVGKHNDTDGKGFKIYDSSHSHTVEQIMSDSPDVLEEYITQHPAYSEIYDKSINTLRIHTIRNEIEARTIFNPLLSIGAAGSQNDHPICDKALRILLTEDGTIISGVDRWRCYEVMEYHPDTGYHVVPGQTLPYVREACEICMEAAKLFPELRYLGWDVAITPTGPVIVEVNSISGLAPKYCNIQELNDMFRFVSNDVEFCYDPLIRANRFAPDIKEIPNPTETYLICLQAALHRHGIEFSNRIVSVKNEIDCYFSIDEQQKNLSVKIGKTEIIEFPLEISQVETVNDIFLIERMASKLAKNIYEKLRNIIDRQQ